MEANIRCLDFHNYVLDAKELQTGEEEAEENETDEDRESKDGELLDVNLMVKM